MDGTQSAGVDSAGAISPERLRERIASGDGAFVLDVRSRRDDGEAVALESAPNDCAADDGTAR